MASSDLRQRLAFLSIRDDDLRRLSGLGPMLEKHADSFVAAFYRHLLSFDPTRKLLGDPDVKERLLAKQRAYLLSLAVSEIDDSYAEERRRIGATHLRIGLEPRWYLGTYALYFRLLAPLVREAHRHNPAAGEAVLDSLHKILMLDVQLALEAYIERRQDQLEFVNRELSRVSRELELSLETRSHELRETTHRAQAAEELASVATIVAGLAHEIGTPMGVIQGHAELLESSVTDEKGQWRVRTIREQIDRISNIIQTLLNIARPQQRERGPVDLRGLIERSLTFLGEKLRDHGIALESELAEGSWVIGDDEKLQQLFLNLFLNAADAMPSGGSLRVTLTSTKEGGCQVRIADTGLGMPPEVRQRVFEPFFTTKETGQGIGLGLTVARRIVLDHGGTIRVESEVERGTEFRIVLPAVPRPEA